MEAITASLRRLGMLAENELPTMTTLTGGVSSDIWKVDLPTGSVCVKRALPQLRVKQLWEAPVKRNEFEVAYLRVAARIAPGSVPNVLAHDAEAGLFVMDYLDPQSHPVWKAQLRDGNANVDTARQVGAQMARIHRATSDDAALREQFATDDIFYPIRLEPYLEATARVHTDLAPRLRQLIAITFNTKLCLVHGDIAPKNILVGANGPIFLDCECAWFGDPAFDLAFCLNHLLLKCLWTPAARDGFLACFTELTESYFANIPAESRQTMERRTAHLLPGLFLARVDGKSPVEYLDDESYKNQVRRCARTLLAAPVETLTQVRDAWKKELLNG